MKVVPRPAIDPTDEFGIVFFKSVTGFFFRFA